MKVHWSWIIDKLFLIATLTAAGYAAFYLFGR